MKPVNLLPDDLRKRQERRSVGFGPLLVLMLVAVGAIGAVGWVLTENQVTGREAELVRLNRDVAERRAEVGTLSAFGRFADMKKAREAGVVAVASARFPWHTVLEEVSHAMPEETWLTKVVGRIAPGARTGEKTGGGTGAGGEDAMVPTPGPAIQLIGCTYKQSDVAQMMDRLQRMSGVAQVLLKFSKEKDDRQTSSTLSGTSDDECRTRLDIKKFNLTISFPPGVAAALFAEPKPVAPGPKVADSGKSGGAASPSGSTGSKPAGGGAAQ